MVTRIFFIFLLIAAPLTSDEMPLRDQIALVEKLQKEANLVVDYKEYGEGGIFRIQSVSDGVLSRGEEIPLKNSQKFFVEQKKKNLIVVILGKQDSAPPEYQKQLLRVRDFVVACGYRRVSIFQGNGVGHPALRLDHIEPKD